MSWKDQSNLHFRSPGGLTFSLSPIAAEICEKRARMENDACANPRTLPMSEYANTQETARSGERALALIDRSRCQMGAKFSITTQHEEVFHSRVSASRVASVSNGAMSVFVGTKRHGRSKQDAVVRDSLRRRGGRRIAIYVPALIGGGAERVAALLATALRTAGHQVTLVVDFESSHNEGFVDPGIERVTLAGAHGRDVLQLADFLKRCQPEIAFAVGAATNIKLVAAHMIARLTRRTSTRIVLSFHGPSTHGSGWLGWAGHPLAPLLTRYASRTVCVSDDLVRHIVERWRGARGRIVRIYNPIAVDRAKPAADEQTLAARPPIVIAAGRLVAQKDYATLIKAIALLRDGNVQLAIYGEGPEQPRLKELAERLGVANRIAWCGYVADPWNAYAAARCFALSSQNEAFGNVVVEPLASGLPVVSTACGGPAEILDGGRYGTLVPIGDAAGLSAAIARALRQPGDPAPRLARARDFAAPVIAARYMALYEEVLSA
jgi:glycosyltransferase involved in cell wall biosynthesis